MLKMIHKIPKTLLVLFFFLQGSLLFSESFFPLMKDIVPKNVRLQRPYGIGYVHYYQNQRFTLSETALNGVAIPENLLKKVEIHNIAHVESIRFDVWVLPFLNLYLIGAYGHGGADVLIGMPHLHEDLSGGYNWTSKGLGFGAIPTFGYGNFFTAVNFNYSFVWRSGSDVANAYVINPRLGYSFPHFRMWIGSMYQYIDSDQSGTLSSGGQSITYDVKMDKGDPWNFLVGFQIPLFEDRMDLIIETGYGERVQTAITIDYRFGEAR